jgi:heat shock protein HslJ
MKFVPVIAVALALAACSPMPAPAKPAAPAAETPPALARESWKLASVGGKPVTVGTLTFMRDGAISAQGACNTMGGDFAQQGPEILIGASTQTLIGCGPERESADEAFFAALLAARRMESDGELMVLKDADGKDLATFTPAPKTAPAP